MSQFVEGRSWMNEQWASEQRAASWNPPFYRFFGSDHSQVPFGLRPWSGDESCLALERLINTFGGDHPRPHVFGRCVSQMWSTGYRPSPDYEQTFGRLAKKAAEAVPAPPLATPTQVTFDGQVWAVKKQFVIQSEMEGVAELLDPLHWEQLAPFFKQTEQIEAQAPKKNAEKGSWQGILKENVAFTWNSVTIQSFEAYLNIDYTVTKDRVRADYSLEYEKDNQLTVDDGFGEARKLQDGRIHYTGLKRMRFASSAMNLIAPAALCMFIENDEDGFRDQLERRANAIARPVPAGASPIKPLPK